MDKLSDYIPLIIIIGSIIFSMIKGSRKKSEEETAKTTLPGHRNQPERKEKTAIKKPKIKTHEPTIITPTPISSESSIVSSEQKDVESTHVPFLDSSDINEVKKAFIYTEIFNRKY